MNRRGGLAPRIALAAGLSALFAGALGLAAARLPDRFHDIEEHKLAFAVKDASQPASTEARIRSGLPRYTFRVIPDAHPADPRGTVRPIGRIEVRRAGETALLQTIDVSSSLGLDELWNGISLADVDFDGYPDLVVRYDGGAKWRSYAVYFFDPRSGRFVRDALSNELLQKGGNGCLLDPERHEIMVPHLGSGDCQPGFVIAETFALRLRSLRKVGEEKMLVRRGSCAFETSRQVGNVMKVVKTEAAPSFKVG